MPVPVSSFMPKQTRRLVISRCRNLSHTSHFPQPPFLYLFLQKPASVHVLSLSLLTSVKWGYAGRLWPSYLSSSG